MMFGDMVLNQLRQVFQGREPGFGFGKVHRIVVLRLGEHSPLGDF